MRKRAFATFEVLGAIIVTAAALFLVGFYDMNVGSPLAVLFGAVNRSAWELMKCAAVPFILYALIELMCVKPYFKNYVVGKAAGLLVSSCPFILLYCVTNNHILSFVFAVGAGFAASYLLTVRELGQRSFFVPAWLFFALAFIMLISFTVYPPRLFIFMDPFRGVYGVGG